MSRALLAATCPAIPHERCFSYVRLLVCCCIHLHRILYTKCVECQGPKNNMGVLLNSSGQSTFGQPRSHIPPLLDKDAFAAAGRALQKNFLEGLHLSRKKGHLRICFAMFAERCQHLACSLLLAWQRRVDKGLRVRPSWQVLQERARQRQKLKDRNARLAPRRMNP